MSALPVTPSSGPELEAAPRPKRWTADEYVRLAELGFLPKRGVELINGEIVLMAAESLNHFKAVNTVRRRLIAVYGNEGRVCQGTTRLTPQDMPEPDVFVLERPFDELTELPGGKDIRLVVEVSLSSLRQDRSPKAALYAHVGISEYWIVNVEAREIEVHRDPGPNGYREIRRLPEVRTLTPLDAPNEEIAVGELLP